MTGLAPQTAYGFGEVALSTKEEHSAEDALGGSGLDLIFRKGGGVFGVRCFGRYWGGGGWVRGGRREEVEPHAVEVAP